jgi:histidine triad (HIT) family protein
MPTNCIFCSIVDGDIPGRIVYEDDGVTAFLDANPLTPGHTLVIPDDHTARLDDVPDDAAREVYGAVHDLVPAIESALDAQGTTIALNNGEAAGQEVSHVHWHLIPRSADDGGGPIHAAFGDRPDLADEELDGLADRIRDAR